MIVLSGATLVLPDRMLSPGTLVIDGDRIVDVRAGSTPGLGRPHRQSGDRLADNRGARVSPSITTTSCPASSTSTCTASRGSTRSISARVTATPRSPRWRPGCRGTASRPSVRRQWRARRMRSPACCETFALARKARPAPRGPRAAGASRKQLHQPRVSRRAAAGVPAQSARGARRAVPPAPIGRTEMHFRPPMLLAEIERARRRRRHRHAGPRARGRPRSDSMAQCRMDLGCRSGTPARRSTQVSRRSRRARGMRRICSTACRRSAIAHLVWSAPSCRAKRSRRKSSATAITCIPRSSVRRWPRKAPRASWRSPTAPRSQAFPRARGACSAASRLPRASRRRFSSDGTLAGSALTMDRAFQTLVGRMKLSIVDAATVCSTTAARELGLAGHGILARDAIADFVVLGWQSLSVVQTYVGRSARVLPRTSRNRWDPAIPASTKCVVTFAALAAGAAMDKSGFLKGSKGLPLEPLEPLARGDSCRTASAAAARQAPLRV